MRWFFAMGALVACGGDKIDSTTDDGSPPPPPDPTTDVVDLDADGFGDDVDCDDTDPAVNPDAIETCDGIDNDCDAAIDLDDDSLDPGSVGTFFVDADLDGYGTDETIEACEVPVGAAEVSGDCDDTLASIHPGAIDTCDSGVDNDCDPATPDTGVTLVDDLGNLTDFTTQFSSGTPMNPVRVNIGDVGTLNLCAGTWYAGINLEADVDIVGAGPALSILDGGGREDGIRIGRPLTASMSGFTLQNFAGAGAKYSMGSALVCEVASDVTVADVTFLDNESYIGGAIVARNGCALSIADSTFERNRAAIGGHVTTWATSLDITGTTFVDGDTDLGGGALFIGDPFGKDPASSSVVCTDCDFERNRALDNGGYGYGGGAIWVFWNADLSMVGGSFTENSTLGRGGAVLLYALYYNPSLSTASFSKTFFDLNTGRDGAANDVELDNVAYVYAGSTVSVSCIGDQGCL